MVLSSSSEKMKLFTVFFLVFLVVLSLVQLGGACGGAIPPLQLERLRVSPIRWPTKTSNSISEDLEIILPQKGDPALLSAVEDGARRGFHECKLQGLYGGIPWKCPLEMYKKLPLFDNKTVPYITREMAFIQAISAAAITHEIAYQCTQNKIPGCGCPLPASTYSHCGDNILFGEKKSRPFTDRLKKQHDAQTDLILHNNALGREVVRTSAILSCKCYPSLTTPYCMATSCWKKLAPFEVVASKLREKYREALQVGLVPRPYDPINRVVSAKDQNLVYLEDSPSFCEQSHTLGYRGTLGRSCRSDVAEDKCKLFIELCNACNLQVEKVARYKRVNCSCKFIYCCKVECEKCTEEYSEITCNALKAVETYILGRAHP